MLRVLARGLVRVRMAQQKTSSPSAPEGNDGVVTTVGAEPATRGAGRGSVDREKGGRIQMMTINLLPNGLSV